MNILIKSLLTLFTVINLRVTASEASIKNLRDAVIVSWDGATLLLTRAGAGRLSYATHNMSDIYFAPGQLRTDQFCYPIVAFAVRHLECEVYYAEVKSFINGELSPDTTMLSRRDAATIFSALSTAQPH